MKISVKTKYILGSILLLFLSLGYVRSTFKVYKGSKRFDDIEEEVFTMEAEKTRLEEEVTYKNTLEYIEEKARNELNLVKPGEKVYIVKGYSQNVLSESADKTERSVYEDANWYMWYKLFF